MEDACGMRFRRVEVAGQDGGEGGGGEVGAEEVLDGG